MIRRLFWAWWDRHVAAPPHPPEWYLTERKRSDPR
jgi:hypothetical protein